MNKKMRKRTTKTFRIISSTMRTPKKTRLIETSLRKFFLRVRLLKGKKELLRRKAEELVDKSRKTDLRLLV
jgi:hypothetical protein